MSYATTNPYTGEVLKTFPNATDAEVKQAIEKAHTAFLAWRQTSFVTRAAIMQKAADLLRKDVNDYAELLTLEMGKLFTEAKAEVGLSARIFEYYAWNAERLLAREWLPVADIAEGEAILVHQPLGVLLCIEPWNFPYYQVARILAPQLSAGNTLLLKHASNVPQCALAIEALVRRAGFPRGTFQTLLIDSAQVEMVLADDRIAAVTVTGSEAAGRAIAAQAGWFLKKSVLELGG